MRCCGRTGCVGTDILDIRLRWHSGVACAYGCSAGTYRNSLFATPLSAQFRHKQGVCARRQGFPRAWHRLCGVGHYGQWRRDGDKSLSEQRRRHSHRRTLQCCVCYGVHIRRHCVYGYGHRLFSSPFGHKQQRQRTQRCRKPTDWCNHGYRLATRCTLHPVHACAFAVAV